MRPKDTTFSWRIGTPGIALGSLSELIDCEVRAGILSVPTDDGLT